MRAQSTIYEYAMRSPKSRPFCAMTLDDGKACVSQCLSADVTVSKAALDVLSRYLYINCSTDVLSLMAAEREREAGG